MAINLKKFEADLKKAWLDVVDDKSETNWALFGYDKQTNDLKVVSTGKTGLEGLVDQLNVAKVMYAFAKVIDTKTELPKYVLVNWQGEGAPFNRKGMCANHIHDVSKFFRGVHVTINARSEEEVEPSSIMQAVSRASATKYNFKERSDPVEDAGPVGTNYKRAQPQREINLNERENFWSKQQEEEKRRKLEEKKKVEEARSKLEEEQRVREEKAAREREDLVQQKELEILKRREAEKNAENAARNELSRRLSIGSEENDDEDDRINRRNQLTKERNEETQRLLSQRSVKNARALFERNTSAGQLSSVRMATREDAQGTSDTQRVHETKSVKPTEEVKSETVVAQPAVQVVEETSVSQASKENGSEDGQISVSPKDKSSGESAEEDEPEEEEEEELEEYEEIYDIRQMNQAVDSMHYAGKCAYSEPLEDIAEEAEDASDEQPAPGEDPAKQMLGLDDGLKARALYDYQAADETEISFDPDDIITHIEQIDEGWWQGMGPDGTYGLFPANYVEIID